jgi:hypothetical protein
MLLARWLSLPLAILWLAAPAGAQDLEEIANVMAEREQATFPFAVSYWVQVRAPSADRNGEPDMFPARVAHRSDRMLWRGPFDDGYVREEHCWARHGTIWWFIRNDPEAWWKPWHGEIAAPPKFTWRLVPADFGLELASQRMSTFLARPSARLRGRENVADFACVVVVVDWVDSAASRIQHPLVLWLAVEHDYYPVQLVRYVREAYPDTRNEDRLTVDDAVYKPNVWRVVDELAVVDGARFPVRARQLSRSRFDEAMQMNVDRATLSFGDEVTDDDFDLPGWMYVTDRSSGIQYLFTPLAPIPLSGIAIGIYVLVAMAVALEARRRWKRRRQRKREGTVWDEVRE